MTSTANHLAIAGESGTCEKCRGPYRQGDIIVSRPGNYYREARNRHIHCFLDARSHPLYSPEDVERFKQLVFPRTP